jgi:SAM-dependent methyltransferase
MSSDPLMREKQEAAARRERDARAEDLRYAEFEFRKAPRLLEKFPGLSLENKRILDFGCRFGGATAWFASHGASRVIGVDIDPAMLDVAREFCLAKSEGKVNPAPVAFVLGGANHTAIEDGSVDLIISEDVVEHLLNPEAIFAEWRRILAPGGQIALSFGPLWKHPHGIHAWKVFHAPWMHVLFSERTVIDTKRVLNGLCPLSREERGTIQEYFELNQMSIYRFEELVRSAGFGRCYYRIHPILKLRPLLCLPILREYFASQIDCVLEPTRL